MHGKIVKGIAGFYYVHVSDDTHKDAQNIYECKAKGVFRKNHEKPLVGDDCEMDVIDEDSKTGNIVRILDRKNSIIRPNVANVDQALVIFASVKPEPNYNLLDRFLILMQQNDIPCLLVFNKKDLAEDERLKDIKNIYEKAGYPIIFTSAVNGTNISELSGYLKGKTTTVAGPSGVGKSSIINLLQPKVVMETGVISDRIERGRHTTRHSELIALDEDSYILDTPGFSSLSLFDVTKDDLKDHYHEFDEYAGACRFDDCIHRNEPGCAVKEAVDKGLISRVRYENYLQLLGECEDKNSRR
ncbi:MAG: ribosome small subunit-dependent GTPase A [Lachnospiraceae bacterium]|nr:ribosome small subunit-dependent GTPase A [Lachnospiraceae bacterium]